MPSFPIDVRPEVAAALAARRPLVALESTLIAHGLPWPHNLETAQEAEAAVRAGGGVPVTIAVWQGRPTIGLEESALEDFAQHPNVMKASRRDLGIAVAFGRTAATTVAATMFLAHLSGIRFLATGGIGGVHPNCETNSDISADLVELATTPVAVICAGAKSIVDIPRTLEFLETHGVPVLGYRTDYFPAFYLRSSGQPVARVDSPEQTVACLAAHWKLDGHGVVIGQPVSAEFALSQDEWDAVFALAETEAKVEQVRGAALTPFLLAKLAQITKGRTVKANQILVIANARLATELACSWAMTDAH